MEEYYEVIIKTCVNNCRHIMWICRSFDDTGHLSIGILCVRMVSITKMFIDYILDITRMVCVLCDFQCCRYNIKSNV